VTANRFRVLACAAVLLGLCWLAPEGLKLLVVTPLLLLLPGVFFAGPLRNRALDFEFVILAIGMSVAFVIVFALVLHGLGAMNFGGWAAAVSAFLALAGWRWASGRRASGDRSSSQTSAIVRPRGLIVSCAVALALLAGGVAWARYGADNHRQFAYSELWMVPSEGPTSNNIALGVKNSEQKATNFDLEVLIDDKVFVRWPEFRLENGEQWTKQLTIPLAVRYSRHVEARLYNRDQPERIYRRVWLSRNEVASR
jgi:hypothetical protein